MMTVVDVLGLKCTISLVSFFLLCQWMAIIERIGSASKIKGRVSVKTTKNAPSTQG